MYARKMYAVQERVCIDVVCSDDLADGRGWSATRQELHSHYPVLLWRKQSNRAVECRETSCLVAIRHVISPLQSRKITRIPLPPLPTFPKILTPFVC